MTGAEFKNQARLLGPAEIRALAGQLSVRPTKTLGQNFVHDPNTVRKIVAAADVRPDDVALEVGPGLGSLTLALLDAAASVTAIEIDPVLAEQLPKTVAERAPELAGNLTVIGEDALKVSGAQVSVAGSPTVLVANLPYNVSVPVLLHLLAEVPTLRTVLVMVQLEVADRLAAAPGSRVYGVPSVKAAYYGRVRKAGTVGRAVFWPEPNVESGLVRIDLHGPGDRPDVDRARLWAAVDAAFAQRRKTLRAALATWAGSPAAAEEILVAAGIDPRERGEKLSVEQFAALAAARPAAPAP
ncbi:16S rRNA (adenine(1518)-N(6)/adenine(1519)-N(6))-dimethyltransferase RsmA [Tsukamurella tyrosinosolvens]|uniref:16S rRNA (adenine(1518)-N(6)/adenine(1519)-N(6))- dimethyltransferase RsmA n=1 Tax=Tsukamurella tyrosinosolvens TaxID=57704 RepID=UPI000795E673|nr:16S rRNA (adenine(1518)-N(6)/adenine(1519)-N(6))-dimethyltransferase RsmA [Tsukamurella tyrosinosolvens]AUN39508.1 16S rRNA (adenine(1518)-N(6)/adenine(1519)-N(6))-dimethyltransferase [Tsukamurella tyrosinosolvens]KXP02758.1 16S rRNA methyltransferase [Tsukamurella tyrosinosolvens]KZL96897.1 16S rRNA methyltransferase [Tsukamurella tyrosinosolvens]MCA4997248.1 16S rRNA (adenine(1518)-N(6)/adenine(1519)-N(6))-dimethyltransferase RsmA [Tsukamurella tyrosinosolvens]WEL94119.1 16S rRNA (adenine